MSNCFSLYLTDLTLCHSNRFFSWRWYAGSMKLKIFFIVFALNPFLVLKDYVASIWKFLWWIVTDLSFFCSSSKDVIWSLNTVRKFLSWILFIWLFNPLLWNIHINGYIIHTVSKSGKYESLHHYFTLTWVDFVKHWISGKPYGKEF